MTTLSISMDDTLKTQVEAICDDLGISLSTAATLFFKQMVRYNGIPFELRADPFYSIENQTRLLQAKERMERTGGTVHDLLEIEEDDKSLG